jgi:hypothetical protein
MFVWKGCISIINHPSIVLIRGGRLYIPAGCTPKGTNRFPSFHGSCCIRKNRLGVPL